MSKEKCEWEISKHGYGRSAISTTCNKFKVVSFLSDSFIGIMELCTFCGKPITIKDTKS